MCHSVYAQQYVQKQESQIVNILTNPGFESGKTGWTFSNPTTVQTVSGTQALFGSLSLKFTPVSPTATTISSGLITVPEGLEGEKCQAIFHYRTNESTNLFVGRVLDASGTILGSVNLAPKIVSGVPTEEKISQFIDFDCPYIKKIEQQVWQDDVGGYITIDGMHLGSKAKIFDYVPVDTVTSNTPITITGGASNPVINHDDSGVTSGTYTKVQVNTKGHVTSGTSLINSDLPDSGVAAATYPKVTVNSKGVVTSGTSLTESDIPNLNFSKITAGVVPISQGGTSATTMTNAFDNLAPSTTKGDLVVHNGTDNVRVPVGTTNYVLTADPSQAAGVSWKSVSATAELSPVIYYNSAAQSIPTASATIVNFNTVIRDPESTVTTGTNWRYVATTSQTVLVATQISFASNNYSSNVIFEANLYKNGANPISMGQVTHQINTATQAPNINGTAVVQLSPGDYFDIRAYQNTGGPQPLVAGVQYSRINIIKLGTSF